MLTDVKIIYQKNNIYLSFPICDLSQSANNLVRYKFSVLTLKRLSKPLGKLELKYFTYNLHFI